MKYPELVRRISVSPPRIFASVSKERYYLKEWRVERQLSQPKLAARTDTGETRVDIRTIQKIEAEPLVYDNEGKPKRNDRTIRALEIALDLPSGGLKTDPAAPPKQPSDEWLLENKDKIFEGLEKLAAKGDVSEIEILRMFARWRDQGIIK